MVSRKKMLYSRPSAVVTTGRPKKIAPNVIDASTVPSMVWPDGRFCFEASAFLFKLFHTDGLSTRGGGGTLATNAAYLSHLIRYCHSEGVDFCNMKDARFTLFMRLLCIEQGFKGETLADLRDNTVLTTMGRFYLKFFQFVGELHGIPDFTTKKIHAFKKTGTRKLPGGRQVAYEFWHHRSFPNRDEVRHRRPLGDAALDALEKANNATSKGFIRRRRHVMLLLLKSTGGRRMEVSMLTVASVKKALASDKMIPVLEMDNVKQNGEPTKRKVPMVRGDLLLIERYLLDRAKIIRSTCGLANDSGALLINMKTGCGLTPNTITTEFTLLVKAAKLDGKACAHMLRHRYLVNLYVELIILAGTRDQDIFIKLLSSDDQIMMIFRERSGHASNTGAEWYTKLALQKILRTEQGFRNVHAREVVRGLATKIEDLEIEARAKNLSPAEELAQMKLFLRVVAADVTALTGNED